MGTKAGEGDSIGKKNVLLLYPYYWPHYKAGGPVQSLFNLVGVLNAHASFYLLSLNRDIDGSSSAIPLTLNQWTKGPQNENIYFVDRISPILILKLIREIKPQAILLNGVFNIATTVPGLIIGKWYGLKTIISPRGMLQDWALRRKSLKKAFFLFFLRLFLKKDEKWHATNDEEKKEIMKFFGLKQKVSIASNIPRAISEFRKIAFPDEHGKIKLVFLSLINPNKNLHLIIEEIARSNRMVTLDIYGPIIDKDYWKLCQAILPDETLVKYNGPVPPWEVVDVLRQYHFFVLPTQGENFGHAIFDALASGVPVIISRNTPWKSIEASGSGFYVDIDKPDSLRQVLDGISKLTESTYNQLRLNSTKYAKEYWDGKDYYTEYCFLVDPSLANR